MGKFYLVQIMVRLKFGKNYYKINLFKNVINKPLIYIINIYIIIKEINMQGFIN